MVVENCLPLDELEINTIYRQDYQKMYIESRTPKTITFYISNRRTADIETFSDIDNHEWDKYNRKKIFWDYYGRPYIKYYGMEIYLDPWYI